jgi:heme exporter protein B
MVILKALTEIMVFDLKQAWRKPGELLQPPLFFALLLAVYGFLGNSGGAATGALLGLELRKDLALFWLGLLLALFLPFHRLFEDDRRDGTLALTLGAGVPAEALFLAKAGAYWLAHALPLLGVFPLAMLVLPLTLTAWGALGILSVSLTLLLSTAAALLAGNARGGLLVYILLLPLALPGIIFATAASLPEAAPQGLWLLSGATLLALAVLPWAGGAALRQAIQD